MNKKDVLELKRRFKKPPLQMSLQKAVLPKSRQLPLKKPTKMCSARNFRKPDS